MGRWRADASPGSGQSWALLLFLPRYLLLHSSPLATTPSRHAGTVLPSPRANSRSAANTLWWTTGREKQHKHRAFPIHLRKSSQYCSQLPISTALHVQEESEWVFNPHPPQPCALPSHKPPWRGPLGTKGEILQMHTSWLALGTGEEHAVSTAPPAPACPASQSLTG